MGEGEVVLVVMRSLAGDGAGVAGDAGEEVAVLVGVTAGDPAAAGERGAAGCRGLSAGDSAAAAEVTAGTKAGTRERGGIVCGGEVGGDGWTVE